VRDDFESAKHALMFLVFFALFLAVAHLCCGCLAPERASIGAELRSRDAGVPRDPTACRSKDDLGHEVWWVFMPERGISVLGPMPLLTSRGPIGSRYVCRDHGKDHNGLWWEQVPPEDRYLP
jgi:hypothetical protein